jgi:hypothetical protein
MTDNAALPTSVLEEPSVNTVAITQSGLDARIAAAFADGAKSDDVRVLIKAAEAASVSANERAERARARALDPALSSNVVVEARRQMEDAAFERDRLQVAVTKLRERLIAVKADEENARRQEDYDEAEAVRDELAKELADLYPAFAEKIAPLLERIAANDRMIEYINAHALPSGAKRLLVAELVARGLPGWATNNIEAPRIVNVLRLPSWNPGSNYLWPPTK